MGIPISKASDSKAPDSPVGAVLVAGGGIAGIQAALDLADSGFFVYLVEQGPAIGGVMAQLDKTFPTNDCSMCIMSPKLVEVGRHINIELVTLAGVNGFVGNFETQITGPTGEITVHHGAVVIATGAKEFQPDEYLYNKSPRVITGLSLDEKIIQNDDLVTTAKTAVFIQCVGSREPDRPYCSRICCTHSIASALHLKEMNPQMDVYILYRDIRTYGEKERLYQQAREKGVVFIRYSVNYKPDVTREKDGVTVTVTDHVLRQPVRIPADLVVLASAVVSRKEDALAQLFKVPMDSDGFFAEAHVKLAPSNFAVDGVFLCGLAHYPKPIDESIAQAQAAAAGVSRLFAKYEIKTLGNTAQVNTAVCSGCGVCVAVCPYNAPEMIADGRDAGKARVNPVLCKGCGLCTASCRSGAVELMGYKEQQIMAMIDHAF